MTELMPQVAVVDSFLIGLGCGVILSVGVFMVFIWRRSKGLSSRMMDLGEEPK